MPDFRPALRDYGSVMSPTVDIETSVISYLTSRRSNDVVRAAHQQLTKQWWANARPGFRVLASELVVREATLGDPADTIRQSSARQRN